MNTNQTLTVDGNVKALMGLNIGAAQFATVQVTGNDARFTFDGTNPVSGTFGLLAFDGAVILLENRNEIENFRVIRDGGGPDVILQIAFETRQQHASNFTNTEA
jgi:hypothetical protein